MLRCFNFLWSGRSFWTHWTGLPFVFYKIDNAIMNIISIQKTIPPQSEVNIVNDASIALVGCTATFSEVHQEPSTIFWKATLQPRKHRKLAMFATDSSWHTSKAPPVHTTDGQAGDPTSVGNQSSERTVVKVQETLGDASHVQKSWTERLDEERNVN